MTTRWLHTLRDAEVVFTGRNKGFLEADLAAFALELGARRVSDDVNLKTTNVLVRGESSRWKYGDYGKKEHRVKAMQDAGRDVVIIDVGGLLSLRRGAPAPTLTPNVPDAPARLPAAQGGDFGAPYRDVGPIPPIDSDGLVVRDPNEVDRGLKGHYDTQDALATLVRQMGLEPRMRPDMDCNYDLGWRGADDVVAVVEVKSLTDDNETFQIRHGLGQVLDYAYRLRARGFKTHAYLAVEREPRRSSHWRGVCQEQAVVLTWAPGFPGVFTG